jgi:hypothetical protein
LVFKRRMWGDLASEWLKLLNVIDSTNSG